MSRKDYQMLASLIQSSIADADKYGWSAEAALSKFAHKLANILGSENSRFDKDRFLDIALGEKESK